MSPLTPTIQEATAAPQIPTGIRVASTLCWLVGVFSLLMAIVDGMPALAGPHATPLPLIVNSAVGLAVCAAAILIRRQRRIGVLVLVLASATPTVIALVQRELPRGGPLLVIIALLLAGANWHHLR
jgi:hypothetical protein